MLTDTVVASNPTLRLYAASALWAFVHNSQKGAQLVRASSRDALEDLVAEADSFTASTGATASATTNADTSGASDQKFSKATALQLARDEKVRSAQLILDRVKLIVLRVMDSIS